MVQKTLIKFIFLFFVLQRGFALFDDEDRPLNRHVKLLKLPEINVVENKNVKKVTQDINKIGENFEHLAIDLFQQIINAPSECEEFIEKVHKKNEGTESTMTDMTTEKVSEDSTEGVETSTEKFKIDDDRWDADNEILKENRESEEMTSTNLKKYPFKPNQIDEPLTSTLTTQLPPKSRRRLRRGLYLKRSNQQRPNRQTNPSIHNPSVLTETFPRDLDSVGNPRFSMSAGNIKFPSEDTDDTQFQQQFIPQQTDFAQDEPVFNRQRGEMDFNAGPNPAGFGDIKTTHQTHPSLTNLPSNSKKPVVPAGDAPQSNQEPSNPSMNSTVESTSGPVESDSNKDGLSSGSESSSSRMTERKPVLFSSRSWTSRQNIPNDDSHKAESEPSQWDDIEIQKKTHPSKTNLSKNEKTPVVPAGDSPLIKPESKKDGMSVSIRPITNPNYNPGSPAPYLHKSGGKVSQPQQREEVSTTPMTMETVSTAATTESTPSESMMRFGEDPRVGQAMDNFELTPPPCTKAEQTQGHIDDLKDEVSKLRNLVEVLRDQQEIIRILDRNTNRNIDHTPSAFNTKDLINVVDQINSNDKEIKKEHLQTNDVAPKQEVAHKIEIQNLKDPEMDKLKYQLKTTESTLNETKKILTEEQAKEVLLEKELENQKREMTLVKYLLQSILTNRIKENKNQNASTSSEVVSASAPVSTTVRNVPFKGPIRDLLTHTNQLDPKHLLQQQHDAELKFLRTNILDNIDLMGGKNVEKTVQQPLHPKTRVNVDQTRQSQARDSNLAEIARLMNILNHSKVDSQSDHEIRARILELEEALEKKKRDEELEKQLLLIDKLTNSKSESKEGSDIALIQKLLKGGKAESKSDPDIDGGLKELQAAINKLRPKDDGLGENKQQPFEVMLDKIISNQGLQPAAGHSGASTKRPPLSTQQIAAIKSIMGDSYGAVIGGYGGAPYGPISGPAAYGGNYGPIGGYSGGNAGGYIGGSGAYNGPTTGYGNSGSYNGPAGGYGGAAPAYGPSNAGYGNSGPNYGGYKTTGGPVPSSGYGPTTGGYGSSNAGYGPSTGGYAPPNGGYGAPTGGYGPASGGYTPPNGGYTPPNGGYAPSNGGYAPPSGGYAPSSGGYSAPTNGYGSGTGGYGSSSNNYAGSTGGYGAPTTGYTPAPGSYTATPGAYTPSSPTGGYNAPIPTANYGSGSVPSYPSPPPYSPPPPTDGGYGGDANNYAPSPPSYGSNPAPYAGANDNYAGDNNGGNAYGSNSGGYAAPAGGNSGYGLGGYGAPSGGYINSASGGYDNAPAPYGGNNGGYSGGGYAGPNAGYGSNAGSNSGYGGNSNGYAGSYGPSTPASSYGPSYPSGSISTPSYNKPSYGPGQYSSSIPASSTYSAPYPEPQTQFFPVAAQSTNGPGTYSYGANAEKPPYYPAANPQSYGDYQTRKIDDLKVQISGLQSAINSMNNPAYTQKPEDQQTIYNLERQISDLKNIVNGLSAGYSPGGYSFSGGYSQPDNNGYEPTASSYAAPDDKGYQVKSSAKSSEENPKKHTKKSKRRRRRRSVDNNEIDLDNESVNKITRFLGDFLKDDPEVSQLLRSAESNPKMEHHTEPRQNSESLQEHLEHLRKQLEKAVEVKPQDNPLLHPNNIAKSAVGGHDTSPRSGDYYPQFQPNYYQPNLYSKPLYPNPLYPEGNYEPEKPKKQIVIEKPDILGSIILKIIDKILNITPEVFKKIANFLLEHFLGSGYSDYGSGGYYGVSNNNHKEIAALFRSLGTFGIIPLVILRIIDTVSTFIKILRKNSFIRNFLVPGGVIAVVVAAIAFLIWWIQIDDNDYSNSKYQIGYNQGYYPNNQAYNPNQGYNPYQSAPYQPQYKTGEALRTNPEVVMNTPRQQPPMPPFTAGLPIGQNIDARGQNVWPLQKVPADPNFGRSYFDA